MKFGAIVIGRNEGERLKHCINSLTGAFSIVYVDSGSTDGSRTLARKLGVDVVELDMSLPFTAARARNEGLKRLKQWAADVSYVQFVDGDCELDKRWAERSITFLDAHADVAAVSGRIRERHIERSIYNWLRDREWDGPLGEVRACSGFVMMRVEALEAVGGFRSDLIAGEEPELCVRLRASGWHIWRIDCEMGLHDAAMTRFGQWWRRGMRAGYAFANGAFLHGRSPERHFVWETRRAWLFGGLLPVAFLVAGFVFGPFGWALWLVYPLHVLQKTIRGRGPLNQRALLGLFHVLVLFPQAFGEIKFLRDRLFGKTPQLIEYK